MASKAPIRKLLIVGWDGAEPTIVAGMLKDGRLPQLASLAARGFFTPVASTVPPSSLPAWTSAMTGVNPGRHGLVDFVRLDPGRRRLRLVTASEREVPTLFELAGRAGLSVACLGMPGSWPPTPDAGVCIAGFDSPVATRAERRAFQPPELFDELNAGGLAWPYGGADELAVGAGWHSKTRRILMQTIETKTRVAEAILDQRSFDLFAIVFSESDTAGHHFWAHHDAHSPRRRAPGFAVKDLGDTIEKTYAALDRALGRLLSACGPQTAVLVLSDHGFGGSSDQIVFVNRWLAAEGLLRFSPLNRIASDMASALTTRAARILPATVKESLLRGPLQKAIFRIEGLGRFGAIDWKATRAFSNELPQNPGIWINDPPVRRDTPNASATDRRLVDRIAAGLLAWRDTRGRPVVRSVHRPGDINPGPYLNRAPDLLVELAEWDGYRLVAAPSRGRAGRLLGSLNNDQLIGSKGSGTSGCHRSYGMLVAASHGKGNSAPAGSAVKLVDICPTAMTLLGLPLPAGLDGRCLPEIAPSNIIRPAKANPGAQPQTVVYTPEQERLVRERLEKLGYL
ncbi:MAG TPA: alkaline phosphatase family protein [Myxococcota bacterium]|nr:alkaline phosphatase family protein [Myxococcota bacterium]